MKIKGFDENLCCRGMQFEIGKEYKIDLDGREMKLCSNTVFHYCDNLRKVHRFYNCNDKNRFCEIEVLGEEITDSDKCGSNHIKIIREITDEELNMLKGYVNGNTGLFNSGDCNSGDCNSGDRNSRNCNSGDCNSGDCNSGNRNSGDRNSGDCNSGDRNSGNRNSGNWNSGDCNSGDCNSGDRNSGDRNSGDRNSGNWNSCDDSNGVFCNKEDDNIRIFNNPSGMSLEEFFNSRYYDALNCIPLKLTEWTQYTKEEMLKNPNKRATGGYLKEYTYKEACKIWWEKTPKRQQEIIKSIPNFDKDVFKDITGINIYENPELLEVENG